MLLWLAALLSMQAQAKPISCGELITQLNSYETERDRYPSLDTFVKVCERDAKGEFDTALMEKTPEELRAYWERQECTRYSWLCKAKKMAQSDPQATAKKELPASAPARPERFFTCKNYPKADPAYEALQTEIGKLKEQVEDPQFQEAARLNGCTDEFVAVTTLALANDQEDAITYDLNYCVQQHCKVDGGWKFIFSKTWTGGESPQCKKFYDLSRSFYDYRKATLSKRLQQPSVVACRCKLSPEPGFCSKYRGR